jgi:hypothetical protein
VLLQGQSFLSGLAFSVCIGRARQVQGRQIVQIQKKCLIGYFPRSTIDNKKSALADKTTIKNMVFWWPSALAGQSIFALYSQ